MHFLHASKGWGFPTYLYRPVSPGAARVAGVSVGVGGVDLGDLPALEYVVLGLVADVGLSALLENKTRTQGNK